MGFAHTRANAVRIVSIDDGAQRHTGQVLAAGDEGGDRVEVLAVGLQRVRRGFAGAAVGQERGEPLRSRTVDTVGLRGAVGHAASISWIMAIIHESCWREEPWGRGEHGSRSPHGGDAGASAIDSAVTRRDGWQVLRFGGLKQPSIVDAEGREAVPMGVRGCQVYRI